MLLKVDYTLWYISHQPHWRCLPGRGSGAAAIYLQHPWA